MEIYLKLECFPSSRDAIVGIVQMAQWKTFPQNPLLPPSICPFLKTPFLVIFSPFCFFIQLFLDLSEGGRLAFYFWGPFLMFLFFLLCVLLSMDGSLPQPCPLCHQADTILVRVIVPLIYRVQVHWYINTNIHVHCVQGVFLTGVFQ